MRKAYVSSVLKKLVIPVALVAAILFAAATAQHHDRTDARQPVRSLQLHR